MNSNVTKSNVTNPVLWCAAHRGECILTAPGYDEVDFAGCWPEVYPDGTLTGVCRVGDEDDWQVGDLLRLSDGTCLAVSAPEDGEYDIEEGVTVVEVHDGAVAL